MPLIKSLWYHIKAANHALTLLHGAAYAATVTYLKVLNHLVRKASPAFRNHVTQTYHGKVMCLEDAARLIMIKRNIECRNLEQVLPYQYAKDLILNNPQNIVAYQCPCRAQKKDPCRPTDVCLVVGEPFVDLVRLFQPLRSRRITPEQALSILRQEDQKGHIHTAWFKTAMLNRFFAICNCCRCCCLGMQFMTAYNMPIVSASGYRAVVSRACDGCGECVKFCPFGAMESVPSRPNIKTKSRAHVNAARCFGCGICVGQCRQGNVRLVPDPAKGIPLNIEALAPGLNQPEKKERLCQTD